MTMPVDAYRAGQNTPPSPPGSTESGEPAEVAVASTDTPGAQRGVRGPRRRLTADEVVESVRRLENQPDLLDADPPGLDAAIEAAEETFRTAFDAWSLARPTTYWAGLSEALTAAVRAAAPALRAAALRDLADEIDAMLREDYAPHAGDLARWLRERADRIGGAT